MELPVIVRTLAAAAQVASRGGAVYLARCGCYIVAPEPLELVRVCGPGDSAQLLAQLREDCMVVLGENE